MRKYKLCGSPRWSTPVGTTAFHVVCQSMDIGYITSGVGCLRLNRKKVKQVQHKPREVFSQPRHLRGRSFKSSTITSSCVCARVRKCPETYRTKSPGRLSMCSVSGQDAGAAGGMRDARQPGQTAHNDRGAQPQSGLSTRTARADAPLARS